MDDKAKYFGRKLDDILYERRMTARDLAKLTGISEASIAQYKKGTYLPQGANLDAIAKALNVSNDILLGNERVVTPFTVAGSDKNVQPDSRIPIRVVPPDRVDELKILKQLPSLDTDSKHLIRGIVEVMSGNDEEKKQVLYSYLKSIYDICS